MSDPLSEESAPAASEQPAAERTRALTIQRLFQDHNRKLVRFLLARLQNEQDAVEVAQEAYVQLLQLEKTATTGLLQAYLFRIARNLAVDRVRRRKVRASHSQSLGSDPLFEIDLEERYLAGEELNLFRQALQELPPKCCTAFSLSKFEDLTAEQIAERLGISPRMVRKYIVQALVYTRLRLDGASPDEARLKTRSGLT